MTLRTGILVAMAILGIGAASGVWLFAPSVFNPGARTEWMVSVLRDAGRAATGSWDAGF